MLADQTVPQAETLLMFFQRAHERCASGMSPMIFAHNASMLMTAMSARTGTISSRFCTEFCACGLHGS